MTTDRDTTTRIVRSWLRGDEHDSADRVLDFVLDAIDTTPQRRATPWPVRRFPEMNTTAKLAAAAAAVIAAALIGFNYLIAPNVGGPGVDDPAPSPSPTAAALRSGPLDPGRYAIDNPRRTPVRFSVTVPAGWTARSADSSLFKRQDQPEEVGFSPHVVTHVYADACVEGARLTEVGPTVDDLVTALADQGSSEAADPVDLAIGGYPAVRIDIRAAAGLDAAACRLPGGLQVWADSTENDFFAMAADSVGSVYIVDVQGERVVITAGGNAGSSAEDLAELDAIVASITFEP